MISIRLLLVCMAASGAVLFVFELIWYGIERKLGLLKRIPDTLLEDTGVSFFFSRYVMQFAFLVALPSVVYGWFYVLVPFYGVRAGIALALFLFVLGIIPFGIIVVMRIKLPLAYVLFHMAGYMLKLMLIYGIIAGLYIM